MDVLLAKGSDTTKGSSAKRVSVLLVTTSFSICSLLLVPREVALSMWRVESGPKCSFATSWVKQVASYKVALLWVVTLSRRQIVLTPLGRDVGPPCFFECGSSTENTAPLVKQPLTEAAFFPFY